MIREVLVRQGLPRELAFLPLVESAFKPKALSRASAHGMWQFMRGTARENGLKLDWYIDERADPEKATAAAARYLRALYGLFDGGWLLALAAYNGGPGRVQRAMRRSGADDFWTLAASSRYLPRETRNFVPLALAAMRVGWTRRATDSTSRRTRLCDTPRYRSQMPSTSRASLNGAVFRSRWCRISIRNCGAG